MSIIGVLLRLRYKYIKTYPGILYVKTVRLNEWIKSFAEGHRTFWRRLWNVGIAGAVGVMVFGIYYLLRNLYSFYYKPEVATPVLPIIPGVTFSLRWLPHFFIALSISVFSHEAAHGIASCVERIRLKSFGLFLVFFLFGAFTEPDEEAFEKAKPMSKLRVYGAGPSVNAATAVVALLLITNMSLFYLTISPFYAPSSGVLIVKNYSGGPIELTGLKPGDVIYGLNNTLVNSPPEFSRCLVGVKPNETLTLSVLYENGTRDEVTIKTAEVPTNKSRGFIGLVEGFNYYPPRLPALPVFGPYHLMAFFVWLWTISISLAMINMLPISALDGGGFLKVSLELLSKDPEKIRLTQHISTAFFIILLGANMTLSILRFMF